MIIDLKPFGEKPKCTSWQFVFFLVLFTTYKNGLADIVDKSIIAAKRVIYRNRQHGKTYSLREVKSLLKSQMILEEYQSGVEGNDVHFLKTWESIDRVMY